MNNNINDNKFSSNLKQLEELEDKLYSAYVSVNQSASLPFNWKTVYDNLAFYYAPEFYSVIQNYLDTSDIKKNLQKKIVKKFKLESEKSLKCKILSGSIDFNKENLIKFSEPCGFDTYACIVPLINDRLYQIIIFLTGNYNYIDEFFSYFLLREIISAIHFLFFNIIYIYQNKADNHFKIHQLPSYPVGINYFCTWEDILLSLESLRYSGERKLSLKEKKEIQSRFLSLPTRKAEYKVKEVDFFYSVLTLIDCFCSVTIKADINESLLRATELLPNNTILVINFFKKSHTGNYTSIPLRLNNSVVKFFFSRYFSKDLTLKNLKFNDKSFSIIRKLQMGISFFLHYADIMKLTYKKVGYGLSNKVTFTGKFLCAIFGIERISGFIEKKYFLEILVNLNCYLIAYNLGSIEFKSGGSNLSMKNFLIEDKKNFTLLFPMSNINNDTNINFFPEVTTWSKIGWHLFKFDYYLTFLDFGNVEDKKSEDFNLKKDLEINNGIKINNPDVEIPIFYSKNQMLILEIIQSYINSKKEQFPFLVKVEIGCTESTFVHINKRSLLPFDLDLTDPLQNNLYLLLEHQANEFLNQDWKKILFSPEIYTSFSMLDFRYRMLDAVIGIFSVIKQNLSLVGDELYFKKKAQKFLEFNSDLKKDFIEWLQKTDSDFIIPSSFSYSYMKSVISPEKKSLTLKMDRIYENFIVPQFSPNADEAFKAHQKMSALQFFTSPFKISFCANVALAFSDNSFNNSPLYVDLDMVACHAFIALSLRPILGLKASSFVGNIDWDFITDNIIKKFQLKKRWIKFPKYNCNSDEWKEKNFQLEILKKRNKIENSLELNKDIKLLEKELFYFVSLSENFLQENKISKKFFKQYFLALLNGRNSNVPLLCLQDPAIKEFLVKNPYIDGMEFNKRKTHTHDFIFFELKKIMLDEPLAKDLIEVYDALKNLEIYCKENSANMIVPVEERDQLFASSKKMCEKLKAVKNKKLPSAILLSIESLLLQCIILDLVKNNKINLAQLSFDGLGFYVNSLEQLYSIELSIYKNFCLNLFDSILDLKFVIYVVEGKTNINIKNNCD